MDMKDIEMMAKGLNINVDEIGKMAKGFGIDEKKSSELLGNLGQMDQAKMTQIMAMISTIDINNLDKDMISKQFGIPMEAIDQFMNMIKK